MNHFVRKTLVACLTLALSAPAMLCLFIPASATSFSSMREMPHHGHHHAGDQMAHKGHAHHGTHHASLKKASHANAKLVKTSPEQSHSLDCLFKCLDEADQSAIQGEATKLTLPSDEIKATPLAILSSKLTADLFAHLLQATGPPEQGPGASKHPAPLRQSNRLRL